jgi:hypothetical protein
VDVNTIAWALFTFIVGNATGGYIVHTLTHGLPQVSLKRPGFEWARRDVYVPEPKAENTNIRKVTDWEDAPTTDGHSLTFTIQDTQVGLVRDLTYNAATVLMFFKCDTPIRAEWRGNHNDYTKLLAIGKHYGWLIPQKQGRWGWAMWLATRERRLRVLSAWLTK